MDLLRIARDFEATEIVQKCEHFLVESHQTHPIDLLKIAKEHGLEKLKDAAIERASKMPQIERYIDFKELEVVVQNEILTRLVERLRKQMDLIEYSNGNMSKEAQEGVA